MLNIKQYFKNKNLNIFFLKTAIFFAIAVSISLFISFYFRHTPFFLKYLQLPPDFYFEFLSGLKGYRFNNSAIFIIVIALIFIKKRLAKLKVDKSEHILFWSILSLSFLLLQYVFKYLTKINMDFAMQHTLFFTILKFFINALFISSLALAIFGWKYIRKLIRTFWKEGIVFFCLFVAFIFVIDFFGRIWFPLSIFVTKTLYFLFSLTFTDLTLRFPTIPGEGPILGVGDFIVGISKDCSGVDSMLLFISLFIFLVVLNWKDINKKRMAILFLPGLVGTMAYNILRVYLLMLVGIFISPEFAIDIFHSNIGWILVLLYFFVFWHFGSKWVYNK